MEPYLVIYSGKFYNILMGLLYTKFYLDFEDNEWKQISNNPLVFQAIINDVSIEIEDDSHKSYKLRFKVGGKLHMFRVTGKFRLTWDDNDLLNSMK